MPPDEALPWCRMAMDPPGVTLTLHVQPGAADTRVAGPHGDALKIRLAAPPVDGKANAALLAFLAERFQVPLRQVMLVRGASARRKTVTITGVDRRAVERFASGARE